MATHKRLGVPFYTQPHNYFQEREREHILRVSASVLDYIQDVVFHGDQRNMPPKQSTRPEASVSSQSQRIETAEFRTDQHGQPEQRCQSWVTFSTSTSKHLTHLL